MVHPKILKGIIHNIVTYYDPEKIVIFGSHAKDYNTHSSDLDLLVIKDSHLPKESRGREVQHLFFDHIIPIDFHFYTKEEFEEERIITYSFAHSIDQTGKIIYEKKKGQTLKRSLDF
jgi:uncharacterized protein